MEFGIEMPASSRKVFLYCIQPFTLLLINGYLLFPLTIAYKCYYSQQNTLLFLCIVIAVLNNQLAWHLQDFFPFFNPGKVIFAFFSAMGSFLLAICSLVGRLISPITQGVTQLIHLVRDGIRTIKAFGRILKVVAKTAWLYLVQFLSAKSSFIGDIYFDVLKSTTEFAFQYGVFGDVLLLLVALLWMEWILVIPWLTGNNFLYFPCGIIAAYLTTKG